MLVYAIGRVSAAFAGDAEERRAAVARLRGRVLRRAMTALGATFIKLGQVMSTRRDLLDPETIDELRALQDRVPPFPIAKVRRILEEDLGAPVAERFKAKARRGAPRGREHRGRCIAHDCSPAGRSR